MSRRDKCPDDVASSFYCNADIIMGCRATDHVIMSEYQYAHVLGHEYYCRTSRLRDCVFDSRSKIPRSGDFSRILESTLGPVLRLISDLELTLGRRLRQSAALVPAEPSLLT